MAQMKVFVSHSHKDNAFCKKLVKALKDAGADVWYDDESLHTGQLGPIIERELRARPVFIVVLSPAALASRWVEDETRWAYNLLRHHDPTRIMLPVLAEALPSANDIWLFLQEFTRIGATRSTPLAPAQAIAKTLRALVLTPAGAARVPTSPQSAESVDDLIAHGKALISQQKHAEAAVFLERATQRDQRNAGTWFGLGYAYGQLGRNQEALAAFDRATALDPSFAAAWTTKGVELGNLGRHQEELAAYDRALALDPTQAPTWVVKGYSLNNLSRPLDALDAFDRALAVDASNIHAYVGKRFILQELGRVREAAEAERRARELGWRG